MSWITDMDECAKQIADSFGACFVENVLANTLPDNKEFINFDVIHKLSGITKVAYCSNLLCFCLFTGDGKVYCVRQCSIKTRSGLEGFMKLAELKAARTIGGDNGTTDNN